MFIRHRRIFCVAVTCLAFFLTLLAAAQEDAEKYYIVEFTDEISLFSRNDDGKELNILSGDELDGCLEAGIVKWYEEDYPVELFDGENGEEILEKNQTDRTAELIHTAFAGEIGCRGQSVKIGVIDSGAYSHPDLARSLGEGYNYLNETRDVTDNIGHGTFVCGLIAASGMGVAEDAEIIPLKCFDSNVTTRVSTIYSAIMDAVDVYGCDIINMSFGLASRSEKLEEAINHAYEKGVIMVASVGNKGTELLYYPAAFEKVIGVGSVDSDGIRSGFSQYNASVLVTAPGENVYSTSNKGSYTYKSGTSFSAPLVSGIIAVMKNAADTMTHEDITENLKASCLDAGDEGYDTYYGYGIINAEGSLRLLLKDTALFVSPIIKGERSSVVIFNNTDLEFEGYCMWGGYSGGCMADMDWDELKIAPGKTAPSDTEILQDKILCFLWKDINDITVISQTREMEN